MWKLKTFTITIPAFLFLVASVMFLFLSLLGLPGRAEIRLDCGDLRHCIYGIVVSTSPMREPMRSQLLSLADETSIPKNTWCRCAIFPLRGSNQTHLMCQNYYRYVMPWIEFDHELARLMLEDIAGYVQRTKGEIGLPSAVVLCYACFEEGDKHNILTPYKVKKDWRENEYLKMAVYDPENETPLMLYLRTKINNDMNDKAATTSLP